MAVPIPSALKSADISRFALRAVQLEKAKPIIAYWSNYWIVSQIISKELQNADDESRQYTMKLMDKLEQFKTDNPDNDAITDDLAGKAYIEQFGLETFTRAENAVKANKASRQTADTYQASATFLELLQIFGPIDPENAAKIKYAKYHALRIAKALKAGEDPNSSNPKPEPTLEEQAPPVEDVDIENLEKLGGSKPRQPSVQEVLDEADRIQRSLAQKSTLDESLHPSRASSVPRPLVPKVEDVPDDADRYSQKMAQQSELDQSLHPSRAPSVPPTTHVDPAGSAPRLNTSGPENFYTSLQAQSSAPPADVSPLNPPADPKPPTTGANYFPYVPSPISPPTEASTSAAAGAPPNLPSAPQDIASPQPPPVPPPTATETEFPPQQQPPHFLPPHSVPPSLMPQSSHPAPHPQPPPPQLRAAQEQQKSQAFYNATNAVPTAPASVPGHQHMPPDSAASSSTAGAVVDEEAMMKAQKHARWAISALNFEDVNTAVRELRGALECLGARGG